MVIIELTNIIKRYVIGEQSSTVLKSVSLSIQQGELLAIVGASGSGKSTLMNIIGLLDTPDAGLYRLSERAVAGLDANELAELRNRHIGFVFQQFNLLPRLTVEQNVALPLTYRREALEDISQRVHSVLTRVGMQHYKHHRPSQLSGGQQQRVAIARALVGAPNLLLADEPTGALDSKTGDNIMNLFLTLHQEGRTIILVTHDLQVASRCSRVVTIADGQIIADKTKNPHLIGD